MIENSDRRQGLAFTVVTPVEDAPAVRAVIEPEGVRVIELDAFIRDQVVQTNLAGSAVAVEQSELLLGVVSLSASGASMVQVVYEQLKLLDGFVELSHADLSSAGVQALGPWLTERLLAVAKALSRDVVKVRRALSMLRREHDETLERFAELETVIDLSTPRRVDKLSYEPGYWTVHLGAEAQGQISQRLPVSTAGVALIELHVEPRIREGEGVLLASIWAGGFPEPAYSWSTSVADFQGGWFPLWLDRALTVEGNELQLELRWVAAGSETLALTLSTPTPLQQFSARRESDMALAAPLAVRVWGAPPGSFVSSKSVLKTVPREGGADRQRPSRTVIRFALPNSQLMQVELLQPSAESLSFPINVFRAEQLDLLIHPVADMATVCVVRNIGVAQVQALSAIVLVDNAKSQPVEFGLEIVPSQSKYLDAATLIKAWTRVEPLNYAEVHGGVDQSSGETWDLILGARMADGADPHLAWAYFKRIELVA